MSRDRLYALGLDSSTQSLTGVVINPLDGVVVYEKSLDYAKDARLNRFGLDVRSYILPGRQVGEADQPPEIYLASVDALFSDMVSDGFDCSRIAVVNVSGQQHGHVYLSAAAARSYGGLLEEGGDGDLVARLGGCFAYPTAPIWKTSDTASQADDLREAAGGAGAMVELTGSDSPLRFTAAVIRRVGQQSQSEYEATETVQLISSLIPSILTGNSRIPWDTGNACGTSLMNYRTRQFSDLLVGAVSDGLPGGREALDRKLPGLVSPDTIVGTVARYFVDRYRLDPGCRVCAGSGDNPQTKVLVRGDLLSLGSSFVNMSSTGSAARAQSDGVTDSRSVSAAFANAMYDGVGRPFIFGCRTNGALVWDLVRERCGLNRRDYAKSDATLSEARPGEVMFLWQPDSESFPPSAPFEPVRIGYSQATIKLDYPGIVESSLGLVHIFSRGFTHASGEPIYVSGSIAKVPEVLRRVAAIWKRPVVAIGDLGAALGAAVAGAHASASMDGVVWPSVEELSAMVVPRSDPVDPRNDDVRAFYGADETHNGYLRRLEIEYRKAADIGN